MVGWIERLRLRGRIAGWITLVAVLLLNIGCDGTLRDIAFHAPNYGKQFDHETGVIEDLPWYRPGDREFYVAAGDPEVNLRVAIIDPKTESDDDAAGPAPAKGTILVLHGYRISADWVADTGRRFAKNGYRAVMVDLRGHGRSEGDYITFGARESKDLVQVVDELERLELIEGPLGVWGVSMGAATAIQYAGRDSRVQTVVAVAPFSSLRKIVPEVIRRFLPGLERTISPEEMTRLIDEAAAEGGFDPDEADTIAAAQRTDAPILILHGNWDLIVPVEHGRAIHEASPDNTELVELDFAGHALGHIIATYGERSIEWFDGHLPVVDPVADPPAAE